MSHLSQNLERLIQMMSIEQLIGLLKQTNTTNNTTNNDILLSPIVQKVIQEYEQEIKELKSNVSQGTNVSQSTNNVVPIVKDYSDDIAKIHKQLEAINTNLLSLADTIKNITQVNSINHVNSEILTSIPAPVTIISGENIRLNIEEKINVDDKEEVEVEELEEDELEEEELEEEELEEEDDEEELEEEEEVKVDDKNICSVCECKVILDEDIVVVDDKNHCGACDPTVLQEEELEEEEVEEEVSDKEDEVADKEEEEVSEEEISDNEEEEEVSEKEISDDEEEVEVSDKEQEEEQQVTNEDEEVFEIEIDDVTYYATHEENGILYAVEKDGDVGPQVGIIKDGEPIFS